MFNKIREYIKIRSDTRIRYKIWHCGFVLSTELNELKRKRTTQWYIEEFIIEIKDHQRNLDKIYKCYGKYNIEKELEIAKSIEIKTLHDCEAFLEVYLKVGKKITKGIKLTLMPLIIGECDSLLNIGEFLLISTMLLIFYS